MKRTLGLVNLRGVFISYKYEGRTYKHKQTIRGKLKKICKPGNNIIIVVNEKKPLANKLVPILSNYELGVELDSIYSIEELKEKRVPWFLGFLILIARWHHKEIFTYLMFKNISPILKL